MVSNMNYKFNPAALILVLLGILAIAFPMASTMTVGLLTGFLFLLIAVFLFLSGSHTFAFNKGVSILSIILAILCIVAAWMIIVDPFAMSSFASFMTYFAGFVMIINGISLLAGGFNHRFFTIMGILNILFGILYLIFAFYLLNPLYLGIVIGIWLILTGILNLYQLEYDEYIVVEKN